MKPEQRRQAVKALLDETPTMSQWAIAKALGCSQKTISRDMAALGLVSANEFAPNRAKQPVLRPVPVQVNGGMTRGDSLVARLRGEMAEQKLIPTSAEEEHLLTAKSLADRIERLEAMIERDGMSRKVDGRIVLHPAMAEARQCAAVLTRVVSGIQTMEAAPKNPVKQRPANSRWRRHNLAAIERDRQAADPHGS